MILVKDNIVWCVVCGVWIEKSIIVNLGRVQIHYHFPPLFLFPLLFLILFKSTKSFTRMFSHNKSAKINVLPWEACDFQDSQLGIYCCEHWPHFWGIQLSTKNSCNCHTQKAPKWCCLSAVILIHVKFLCLCLSHLVNIISHSLSLSLFLFLYLDSREQ